MAGTASVHESVDNIMAMLQQKRARATQLFDNAFGEKSVSASKENHDVSQTSPNHVAHKLPDNVKAAVQGSMKERYVVAEVHKPSFAHSPANTLDEKNITITG